LAISLLTIGTNTIFSNVNITFIYPMHNER